MATPRCESGAQLLARLGSKPDPKYLEPCLFPNGPSKRDVIELYGEEGCGKTETLLHLVLNTILPQTWRGFSFNGQEAGVIVIDTDYHFSMLRLATLLENRVDKIISSKTRDQENECEVPKVAYSQSESVYGSESRRNSTKEQIVVPTTQDDKETFLKLCLKRLHVVRCSNPTQLIATLHSLDALLLSKPEICVLMVDSLSSFYWIDHSNGCDNITAREDNQRSMCRILSKLISSHNLVCFATKPSIIQRKSYVDSDKVGAGFYSGGDKTGSASSEHTEYLCKAWQKMVTFRWLFSKEHLLQSDAAHKFSVKLCNLLSGTNCHRKFTVSESGITYI